MTVVRNCSSLAVSLWGKRSEKGNVSGKELYLDDLAPGGVAEFPRYGALVVRRPDKYDKGQRLAGPIHHHQVVIEGKSEAELKIVKGSRGRCAAFTTMEVALLAICVVLAIMAVVVTVLLLLLRRRTRAPPAGSPAGSPAAAAGGTLSIQRYTEQQRQALSAARAW